MSAKAAPGGRLRDRLLAQLQLLRDRLITAHVGVVQVIQQTAALADHHQQSAARTVILAVLLKVLGQMIDPLGQQSDLHIRRTRVLLVQSKRFDCLCFNLCHSFSLSIVISVGNVRFEPGGVKQIPVAVQTHLFVSQRYFHLVVAIGGESAMLWPSKIARHFQGMGNLQVNLVQ